MQFCQNVFGSLKKIDERFLESIKGANFPKHPEETCDKHFINLPNERTKFIF